MKFLIFSSLLNRASLSKCSLECSVNLSLESRGILKFLKINNITIDKMKLVRMDSLLTAIKKITLKKHVDVVAAKMMLTAEIISASIVTRPILVTLHFILTLSKSTQLVQMESNERHQPQVVDEEDHERM
jgi:hypothetical protein